MKRLTWGIGLVAFALLCFASAGQNPQGPTGSIVFGIMCIAGGGPLIYAGRTYLKLRSSVGDAALQMLREDGKIHCDVLAARAQVRETRARELLADLQRKGVVPFNAEVA